MRVSYSKYDVTAGEDLGDKKTVYMSGSDIAKLAKADSENTLPVIGFTDGSVLNGETVRVITNDLLGGFSGLVAGDSYYLSQTSAGEITNVKPTSGIIVRVGVAKNSTELDIHILNLENVATIHLRISDFVENADGTNNNVDVDKLVDKTNKKIGKRVTGNLDNQDIDFDMLVLLPKNFANFEDNAIQLELRVLDMGSASSNNITVHIYGTDDVEVGTGFDLTPSTENTWETKIITKSQLSAGTFVAEQMFRISIHVIVDNEDKIDISDGIIKLA